MVDKRLIVSELRKLGDAVGYKLTEERFKQYIEDLQVLTDRSFTAACNSLRTSWERASFPPVGAIINKARELRGDGHPNSIAERDPSKPKDPPDPKTVEALRRHEEYLKMTGDEYMKVMMAAAKHWQGH